MATKKVKGAHYVDNKVFHQAMIDWKEECREAEEMGEPKPRVTEYIGECFLIQRNLKILFLILLKLFTMHFFVGFKKRKSKLM